MNVQKLLPALLWAPYDSSKSTALTLYESLTQQDIYVHVYTCLTSKMTATQYKITATQ